MGRSLRRPPHAERATWWGPCALKGGRGPRWRGREGSKQRVLLRPPLFSCPVLSALVTGESLERLRRGLAAATSNPDPPTGSTNQLLPTGGDRAQGVQDLEGTDLNLFKGGCGGLLNLRCCSQLKNTQAKDLCFCPHSHTLTPHSRRTEGCLWKTSRKNLWADWRWGFWNTVWSVLSLVSPSVGSYFIFWNKLKEAGCPLR